MTTVTKDGAIVGIGRDGATNAIVEKLDILIEDQQELRELVEELVEKISDLSIGRGSGYSFEQ